MNSSNGEFLVISKPKSFTSLIIVVGFSQSLKITANMSFLIHPGWKKLNCLWRLQLVTGGVSSLWKGNYYSEEIRYLGKVIYFQTNTNTIMRTFGFTLPILTVQDSNMIWQTNRTLSTSLKTKILSYSNLCDFYDFISSQIKSCCFGFVFFLQITSEDISFILIYIVLTSIICSVINLPCQNDTTQNFLIISKCEN